MDLILAYLAGLLTLINPCVLPVLPIVLATALQSGRAGPLVLTLGMSGTFVLLGVGLSAFGRIIGLSPEDVARAGAVVMVALGLVMLLPRAQTVFAAATAGMASRADARLDGIDRRNLSAQLLSGVLLGAVWVPCIGPTLGGAIALASTGQDLGWAAAIMASFAAGISTVMLTLAYGAQAAIRARRDRLRALSGRAGPILGLVLVATGLILFFELQRPVEAWLISVLPYWLQDLSVRF